MQRTFPRFHGKSFIFDYSGNRGKSQFILPKSVAQRNAHASGGADGLRIGGDEFRLACNLGKRIVRNGIADHRDGLTVIFRRDQLRGVHAAQLIAAENYGQAVAMVGNTVSHNPLSEVAGKTKFVPADAQAVRAARSMGISLGD